MEHELECELARAMRREGGIAALSVVGFTLAFTLICVSVLISNVRTIKVVGVVLGTIYLMIIKQCLSFLSGIEKKMKAQIS